MGAPLPPVPNVVSVQVQGTITGEVWENVLHFAYSGPTPTQPTLATMASNFLTSWSTHVTPLQNTVVTMNQVVVIDIASSSGAEGIAVNSVPGTRAGGQVPANAAFLIGYPAPTRFRGGHFRTYLLAGIPSDLDTPMHWNSAFQTLVSTSWQAFLNTTIGMIVGGNQITQIVGLRRHGKFLPNAGPPNFVLTTPIIYPLNAASIVVHGQVASQKGRIGRRSK